jgi:hypothetical protein
MKTALTLIIILAVIALSPILWVGGAFLFTIDKTSALNDMQ